MALKRGYKQLIDAANARIETVSIEQARAAHGGDGVLFVDLRDVRELEREGMIPGAFHAPRGMLEFWVDPDSPYHKPALSSAKRLVLYCQSGWRSALAAATLLDMGVGEVCHVGGGFAAWKAAGGPVAEKTRGGG